MGRKQEYKETNLEFLKELSSQEGVYALPCGIYYKVLEVRGLFFLMCGVLLPFIIRGV